MHYILQPVRHYMWVSKEGLLLDKAHRILEAWYQVPRHRTGGPGDVHQRQLYTLYKEFWPLYEDQEALVPQGYGNLGKLVGCALARLPFVKELHINEANWSRGPWPSSLPAPPTPWIPGFPEALYDQVVENIHQRIVSASFWERKASIKAIGETLLAIQNFG